ncbi:hypothetical protein [Streptomyces sp. NPDC087859]|uniref:hypothetical protein n=1 Tax=Streptomyces sp. NPDC087859 TaxID=3365812 RepID=UPI003819477A
MTLRQVGGAIGIGLLGSLLADTYRDRLDVTGLPARAADTAGESVVAAHLVAGKASPGAALLAAAFLPGARKADESAGTPDMVAPQADARQ